MELNWLIAVCVYTQCAATAASVNTPDFAAGVLSQYLVFWQSKNKKWQQHIFCECRGQPQVLNKVDSVLTANRRALTRAKIRNPN